MSFDAPRWNLIAASLVAIILCPLIDPVRGVGLVALTNALPTSISADGRFVAGLAGNRPGETPQPFVWSRDTGMRILTNEAVRPGTRVLAPVMSKSGHAAIWVTADPPHQGYRWTPERGIEDLEWGARVRGIFVEPRWPSRPRLVALGTGDVLMLSVSITDGDPPRAYRWTPALGFSMMPEVYDVLGASADGQVLLGRYASWSVAPGVLRVGAGTPLQELPSNPGVEGGMWWLAPDGLTVMRSDNRQLLWRWTVGSGAWELMPTPENSFATVLGGTANGTVLVGWATLEAPGRSVVSMLWRDQPGWTEVRSELRRLGVNTSGWQLEDCSAISSEGRVLAGSGRRSFSEPDEVLGWIAILDDSYEEPRSAPPAVKYRRAEVYEFTTRLGVHYQRQERIPEIGWIPRGEDLIGDGKVRRFFRSIDGMAEEPEFRYVELP